MKGNSASGVQVLEKVFKLIDVLAMSEKPLSLKEISSDVGFHKSTLYRLLSILQRYRYVVQNKETKKYKLGIKFLEISNCVTSHIPLLQIARPFLEKLRNDSGETIHLVIRDEDEAVYISKFESLQAVRLCSRVGQRIPLHSTAVGKIILSGLFSNEEILEIVHRKKLKRYTDRTIVSPKQLIKEIGKVKEKGIAIDDRESQEDVRCVAAPIKNSRNEIMAAISISGPATRLSKKKMSMLIKLITRCAETISLRYCRDFKE